MHRNSTPSANHLPLPTPPFYPTVLPAYQRLLGPSGLSQLPAYQSPLLQNGTVEPGLFLIDRGRKTVKIPTGLQVTIQTNPGIRTEASTSQVLRSSNAARTVQVQNPQAPNTYRLLGHVLGSAHYRAAPVGIGDSGPDATALKQAPATGPGANNGPGRELRSPLAPDGSAMSQRGSQEKKRKLPTAAATAAAGDAGKAEQTPSLVRAKHAGRAAAGGDGKAAPRDHSSRDSTPTTSTQKSPGDRQRTSLGDTPKTSAAGHSNASGSGRKRSHDDHSTPLSSQQADLSNPTGKKLDRLSEAIWQNFSNTKQNTQRLYLKEHLRQTLESIIQAKYPGSILFLVGSSLNGFATNDSDTDLCLMVSDKELNQKLQAPQILISIHRLLLQRSNFVTDSQVIYAKVPILKFVCSQKFSGLECDININNATGIRNTHLLQTYSKLDWRVAPLVILVKQWASAQGINDASQGTLSSYSLVLMVLNYLQVKCDPCVIPCLHQAYSSTFNSHSDVRYLYDSHPSNPLPSYIAFRSKNTDSLWSLLSGFFEYYVQGFNFQSTVICVRLGRTYPLSEAPYNTRDWVSKYIYIEEPFDRNNTARAVYNYINFSKISRIFEKTYHRIVQSGDSDSGNAEKILNMRMEGSSREAPPQKKKKR